MKHNKVMAKVACLDFTGVLTVDQMVPGMEYDFWYDRYQYRLYLEKNQHMLMVPVNGVPTVFSGITPLGVPNCWGDNRQGYLGRFTKEDILDAGPINPKKYNRWLFTREEFELYKDILKGGR